MYAQPTFPIKFCGVKIAVSFLCVCSVIDHKFCLHFVKVPVDPRGDSQVDPQTTLTML